MADVGGAVMQRLDGLVLAAIDDDDAEKNSILPAQRSPAARQPGSAAREMLAAWKAIPVAKLRRLRRPHCRPAQRKTMRRRAGFLDFNGNGSDFQFLAWPNRACARCTSLR